MSWYNRKFMETVFNFVTVNPKLRIGNIYKRIFMDLGVTLAKPSFCTVIPLELYSCQAID